MNTSKAKQLLKWSLPLGLALVLAACGGGSSNKNDDATPSESELHASSPTVSPSESDMAPSESEMPASSPSVSPSVSPSASVEIPELPGFARFKDEESGLEIQYPKEWTMHHDGINSIAVFTTPPEDGFPANVTITTQDLGGDKMDLDQYVDQKKKQMQEAFPDFKMIEDESFLTDDGTDLDIRVIKFTVKQGDIKMTLQQLLTIKNGKAYGLTYTADDDTFDKYVEKVGQMVTTLVIN